METARQVQVAPVTVARDLKAGDLRAALRAGWADFMAFPAYGLFFAAIFVLAGWYIWYILYTQSAIVWLIPTVAGFPLLAPFVAVGLYEVSRRREAGLPVTWRAVLGAVRGRGDEQIIMMGGLVFLGFTFWISVAHGVFAIFMAESGVGGESLAALATPSGLAMLAVGSVIGALIALTFYAVTVISLPLLVDRDVDFLTAIIVSLATVRSNARIMVGWAVLIGAILLSGMLPLFLGLLAVLPWLGHATWHLYRRAVPGTEAA